MCHLCMHGIVEEHHLFQTRVNHVSHLDITEAALSFQRAGHVHATEEGHLAVCDIAGNCAVEQLRLHSAVVALVDDVKQTVTLCLHVNLKIKKNILKPKHYRSSRFFPFFIHTMLNLFEINKTRAKRPNV